MEFMLTTTLRPSVTPEHNRELLKVFSQWQPPEGATMKMLYIAADGQRSFGLFETDSAAALAQITNTFADYLEFEVHPVLPAQEGASILGQRHAWVDSVIQG